MTGTIAIFNIISKTKESTKTPSTRSRVLWKTKTFFYEYVQTYPAFSGTKNGGFKIRSPGWRVLKTEIHCICVDGRKRRLSNTMTSCLGSRVAFPHIRFKNVMCGRRLFLIRRKKIFVFENTRLRVDEA